MCIYVCVCVCGGGGEAEVTYAKTEGIEDIKLYRQQQYRRGVSSNLPRKITKLKTNFDRLWGIINELDFIVL